MINITDCLQEIVAHVCRNVPIYSHIDPDQIMVCFAKSRKKTMHGIYAKVCPTRFPGGKKSVVHRGREFSYPTIMVGSNQILYVIYFYYPRFQDLTFETKLLTIFHELYHISPRFDGHIRRFPGKNYQHGHSKEAFDEPLKQVIADYIATYRDEELLEVLKLDFKQLQEEFGRIEGQTMQMPKAFAVMRTED